MEKVEIMGIQETIYVQNRLKGKNCKFTSYKEILNKHTVFGYIKNDQKIAINLEKIERECDSGWSIAKIAIIEVKQINNFQPFTHVPKKKIEIKMPLKIDHDNIEVTSQVFENQVFKFDNIGEDEYYPNGTYAINFDLFKKTPRFKQDRVVWIWTGPSGLGKTFLSSKMVNLEVYETDFSNKLPNVIYADIIIIGNKYKFTIDDVKTKIFGKAQVIISKFESQ